MATKAHDIVVAGHFSLDSILLPTFSHPCSALGGSVAYVSLAARTLGSTVSIISKVGSDFPNAYRDQLQKEAIDLSWVKTIPDEVTTSFSLTYSENLSNRALRLEKKGSPLRLEDLPKAPYAQAIHVAPITSEISLEVVDYLEKFTDCLSLDPQGMTRSFDKNGSVNSAVQMDDRVLGFVRIFKSSLEEITLLTGHSDLKKAVRVVTDLGPTVVIVTKGANGSVLFFQETIYAIPACKSARVVDPTGAGDVFMGAFLAEYVRRKDCLWCACVGSAAASLVIEGVGTSFFGDKEEIYRRATIEYEKEIKQ
jgi:sugar/nucleoside kinase (ribokinase family)